MGFSARTVTSADARQQFKEEMLSPEIVRGYCDSVGKMIHVTHSDLDALGGEQAYLDQLHDLIDEAVQPSSLFDALIQRSP
jgi:hypothetical protein